MYSVVFREVVRCVQRQEKWFLGLGDISNGPKTMKIKTSCFLGKVKVERYWSKMEQSDSTEIFGYS